MICNGDFVWTLGAVAGWLFILIFRFADRFFASLPAPIYA